MHIPLGFQVPKHVSLYNYKLSYPLPEEAGHSAFPNCHKNFNPDYERRCFDHSPSPVNR